MKLTSSVNHKDSYFDHLVLTKIRGKSTYETLHHLKNELKSNLVSVPTTLGGGNYGYLGMILTPIEFHCIAPANPFTRPPNPGVLVPNPASMDTHIVSAEDTHRTTKQIYLKTLLLKLTIIHQIIEAVDTKCLAPFTILSPEKSRHSSRPYSIFCTIITGALPRNNLTTKQLSSNQLPNIWPN